MSLSVISLNCEGDRYLDRIQDFLQDADADVICLQEIFMSDAEHLGRTLGCQVTACLREARRVLRPSGELFLTLNSQANAKFVAAEREERVVDGRTVYKNEPGHPAEGVPHTYLDERDVLGVAKQGGFRVAKLQHIEDIYVVNGQPKRGWHYYCIFA
jgi:hypothetical protein